jgi:thioredoxin/glutathione reductase (selenoprotein)
LSRREKFQRRENHSRSPGDLFRALDIPKDLSKALLDEENNNMVEGSESPTSPLAHGKDYDLVVIGGGSGGLAAAKEAARHGAKVACFDFVKPSEKGTTWGLGGTCVNVGCIPKKLMHQAGILGESFSDANAFGWTVEEKQKHDWGKMVSGIQDHIGSLNFGYRTALREKKVDYKNEYCSFVDANTVKGVNKRGVEKQYTFDKCIIAVGGRPSYLDAPGARELCITSDDVFSLENPPGKTLCVGASYISLETAGFLNALGYDTSVVVRSVFLRGFDTEIAAQIVGHMERHGTRMIRDTTPQKFEKTEDGKIKVEFKNTMFGNKFKEEFDTVVLAVGRDAVTEGLNLPAAGVEFNPKNGKIPCVDEQTNVPHIYAIGDVLDTRQELTPVAIKAGVRLAHRIYGDDGKPKLKMNYDLVPTTVFTPLEYGCVGMSEELAKETYGEENIESYLSYFKPLEWTVNHSAHDNGTMHREDNACFAKVIVNKADSERVVGLHYLGPNAGEVTQGYAVAMKMNMTKQDLDDTVGIHPTVSEQFTTMTITRSSGEDPQSKGC